MMQQADERAFPNQLQDYDPRSESLLDSSSGVLDSKLANPLQSSANQLYAEVAKAYSSGKYVDLDDGSVYTGGAGVALLHLKMGDCAQAEAMVKLHLRHFRGRHKDCTFLCGDCGPLATAALVYNRLGSQFLSQQTACIERILQMEKAVCESKHLPNEMLYGRAGYLYTLLLLQKELGEHIISKQSIINVALSIVHSGQELSQKLQYPCPLMFVWYNEYYSGAAHGHAGIVYILLTVTHSVVSSGLMSNNQFKCPLTYVWHSKHYFGGAHGYAGIMYILLKVAQKYPEVNIDSHLVSTVDFMMNLRFPSGNYPSSFESGERDKLVHWCHGAPGFIYMFAAAYEKYGNDKYKQAALDCTEVIWQRGLLRKGYGLCHGVAGNGYAFLCAFNMTGDPKHLHRAHQFALWCCDYGKHGCRTPDRPYSLFEGMAGTSYFLHDVVNPGKARFPAFEL